MVRLKVFYKVVKGGLIVGFNSNMVRLKAKVALLAWVIVLLFQFQYGAIKSVADVAIPILESCFNSNMVRLKETETMNPFKH